LADVSAQRAALSRQIIDEVVWALGFTANSWQRKLLGPIFWWPANRFAGIMARIDRRVAEDGFSAGAHELVQPFVHDIEVRGADTIPPDGPVIIVSNHPGAYDVACISANAGRDDIKIIASTVPFIDHLPHIAQHLIPVTREPHPGMRGVRQAIRHLRAGGALLIFPSGVVDPDPGLLPGAYEALENWSASVQLMLRQAPGSQLVVTIVSDVLSAGWLKSPITRLQKEVWRQRKLAEFFQLMQQILFPGSLKLRPSVSFAAPIPAVEILDQAGEDGAQRRIVSLAQALLLAHTGTMTPGGG
jgi:hypothetical protein